MSKHIDVRGPVPVYISGFIAIQLPTGTPRTITVEQAEEILRKTGELR